MRIDVAMGDVLCRCGTYQYIRAAIHRAAQEGPTDLRDDAIDRLAFFAAEESLPVLTALLDDPVFAVRARALEALEKIEATLSQQEKWRERFGKKKKG